MKIIEALKRPNGLVINNIGTSRFMLFNYITGNWEVYEETDKGSKIKRSILIKTEDEEEALKVLQGE